MITDPKELTDMIQAEYDLHYSHYRRGCRVCIVYANAIRDLAHKLGVPIKEQSLAHENPTVTRTGAR